MRVKGNGGESNGYAIDRRKWISYSDSAYQKYAFHVMEWILSQFGVKTSGGQYIYQIWTILSAGLDNRKPYKHPATQIGS